MTILKELKPTKKERVIDLVEKAGFDISDWFNYSKGKENPGANPRYCYEWAFYEPKKITLLSIWFTRLEQKGEKIVAKVNEKKSSIEMRTNEKNYVRAGRAEKMNEIMLKTYQASLPVRVMLCTYKTNKEGKSKLQARELDDQFWDIEKYDEQTGDCLLIRRDARVSREKVLKRKTKQLTRFSQKEDFEGWLISIGKTSSTAKKYSGTVFGPIIKWALEDAIINEKIDKFNSLSEFEVFSSKVRKLKIFKERDSIGNHMYGRALSSFVEYLSANFNDTIEKDLNEIITNISLDETEITTQVQARLGQGLFRRNLEAYWNGCSVTAIKQRKLLVASHIKPWRYSNKEERIDYYNGLLLMPNLDKTFDLGYISFDKKGLIQISNQLEEHERLGIKESMRIKLEKNHQPYMEYHREVIFHQ